VFILLTFHVLNWTMVDSAKLLLEQGNVSIKEIGKEDVVVAESNCSTVRTVC